jgi:hypothetical protein
LIKIIDNEMGYDMQGYAKNATHEPLPESDYFGVKYGA